MAGPPVHHLDLRAFCYQTEVPDRVDTALRAVYPDLDREDEPAIEHTTTEGHYGNRIDIHEAHLSRAAEVRTVFDRLEAAGLLTALRDEVAERVTEDTELFIRLDKQAAYADGTLRLGTGIEVRATVEAYPATREGAIENLTSYLDDRLDDR